MNKEVFNPTIKNLTDLYLGSNGAMISPSKSSYRRDYPDNEVVFNANVATPKLGKIWWGDIDITKSTSKLQEFSTVLGETIYIFHEFDMRDEDLNIKDVITKHIYNYYTVDSNGYLKVNGR